MKLWHWKSHWNFLWHWKDTETTLKNIYKGNHSDNPGLSHRNIFLCCSRTLKSHWKVLNHTEKFSALLIPFVPRFFSVTVNFQCDFQCHNFIVIDHAYIEATCYEWKIQKKNSRSDSQGLLFVFEWIVVIKSIDQDKAYWKYCIMVRLYLHDLAVTCGSHHPQ